MKTLVLYAHPAQQHSRVNRTLAETAQQVAGVEVVDLYAEYPRFTIDIDREQQRLRDHDAIVFQFPLMWYSTPPILKEWQDLVLEHGFAYGHGGTALSGKLWLCALTAGAPLTAYGPEGRHRMPLRSLLAPLETTANLCRMPFLPPYVLYGALDATETRCMPHAEGYRHLLEALRDDRLDLAAARTLDHLTVETLPTVIKRG
ncbi:MAG: flavodoxin family protein [Rhodobacteraceae bacterium]|nr:flavodoxin family protein [Paracoccaceae bacterium]